MTPLISSSCAAKGAARGARASARSVVALYLPFTQDEVEAFLNGAELKNRRACLLNIRVKPRADLCEPVGPD